MQMGLYEDIQTLVNSRTLKKARTIASKESNFKEKIELHEDSLTIIRAQIVSSHGWPDSYDTCVVFNNKIDKVVLHSCECMAHQSYSGPCKHCCALAINYTTNPFSFFGNEFGAKLTSPQLASLLETEAEFETPP